MNKKLPLWFKLISSSLVSKVLLEVEVAVKTVAQGGNLRILVNL